MEKLNLQIKINLALAAVYSLLSISFHADISFLAFFISASFTAVLYYFTYIQLVKKDSVERLSAVRRTLQYEPFVYISAFAIQRSGKSGFPYAFDLICALVWIALMILEADIARDNRWELLNEKLLLGCIEPCFRTQGGLL
nr:hypothetical protein [Treponema sp.]